MAARQIWLFLADADIPELFARLEHKEPGLVASSGRYFRGDPSSLLTDPSALERAQRGEARLTYLYREIAAAPTQGEALGEAPQIAAPVGTVTAGGAEEDDDAPS